MPRPPRISFPGAVFHVLNRFVDKHPFFEREHDYRRFLEIYFECANAFGIVTYAWCLMPNHFHFCIELTEANISEFLQRFLTRAAKTLNRSRERVGHLLQDRTKSLLVDTENYFETAVGYVLLNPVRGGLAKHPRDYEWCSAEPMLRSDSVIPVGTLAERVTGRFIAPGKTEQASQYLEKWLAGIIIAENRKRFEQGRRGSFLSSRKYRRAILKRYDRRIRANPSRVRRNIDCNFRNVDWRRIRVKVLDFVRSRRSNERGRWLTVESATTDIVTYSMHVLGRMSYSRIAQYFGDTRTLSKYGTAVHRIRERPERLDEAKAWCQAFTFLLSNN